MGAIKLDDLLNERTAKKPETINEILNALLQSRDEIDSLSASIAYDERQIQDAQKRIRSARGIMLPRAQGLNDFRIWQGREIGRASCRERV